MLTLKLIREETERVVKGLEKKHFKGAKEAIDKVLEFDKQRRNAQQKLDKNLSETKQMAAKIGGLMKQGLKDEAEKIKAEVAKIKEENKVIEEQMEQAQAEMTSVLYTIPNIPNEEVPEGASAADNVVVKEGAKMPELPENAMFPW